ncbi:MAG: LacI family DNA-binding transcriptional regulator [Spirochaetota bacterium]
MADKKLRDVADKAGVSLATASLVLSGKGKISQKVADRVRESARLLGYKRKPGLSSKKKRDFKYIIILHYDTNFCLWNFSRPFITELESILLDNHYYPIVIHMLPQLSTNEIIKEIKSSGAGAIFSMHYVNEPLFEQLENLGFPIIILNNSNFQKKFFSVLVDDYQGAYEGTTHLIELGHRNIVFAEYKRPEIPTVVTDRFLGFKKAMDENNLGFTGDGRISVELEDMEGLYERFAYIYSGKNPPTAVFVHDDYFAACVMVVLHKLGLKVPQDVSLIAPGDVLDYNQPFTPRITTMRINSSLMVKMAWELMMNRLETKPEEIHVVKIKQTLIDRGSSRPL